MVGDATVRTELAGISPAGVSRQRSRVGSRRTAADRSPSHALDCLDSPRALPVPWASLPRPDRSLNWWLIGSSSWVGDSTPCQVGFTFPYPARPGFYPGVLRGRIGTRHSDRRLSHIIRYRRDCTGSNGFVLVTNTTAVGWFVSPDRSCHFRDPSNLTVRGYPYL